MAFWRLDSERTSCDTFIPWSHRLRYARDAGLDDDVVEDFADIIGSMDSAFLKWHRDKTNKS